MSDTVEEPKTHWSGDVELAQVVKTQIYVVRKKLFSPSRLGT